MAGSTNTALAMAAMGATGFAPAGATALMGAGGGGLPGMGGGGDMSSATSGASGITGPTVNIGGGAAMNMNTVIVVGIVALAGVLAVVLLKR